MTSAAVISVGDELTSGHRVDTNSAWISNELVAMGIPVVLHLTVGDDLEQCASAVRYAGSVCPLIVMTGGLGPTADDITRQAISMATQRELSLDADSLAHIQSIFTRRGRTMSDSNRVQAMFPVGTVVVPNPHGTAPGIDLVVSIDGRDIRVIALPGVPAEAKEMFQDTIRDRLCVSGAAQRMIRSYTLKCFGMGESELESKLGDLTARGRNPLVGITVHQATISLRITASGDSEADCAVAAAPTLDAIRAQLGSLVFGEESDEMQDAVIRLLRRQRLTLAVADAYSQGLMCHWLAAADPTGHVYRGGVMANSVSSLATLLKPMIPSDVETAHETPNAKALDPTGVNVQVNGTLDYRLASQCAVSLRHQFNADIGLLLGSTGLLLGSMAPADSHEAQIFVVIADSRSTQFEVLPGGGHPQIRIARAAKFALNTLREQYSGLRQSL